MSTGYSRKGTGENYNNRLITIVEMNGGLSNRQKKATGRKGASRKYCAVITLDVKNAFHSANWELIIKTLARLGIPGYLIKIMNSYFTNRKLCYRTDDGVKTYNVTDGLTQGSILGHLLWNIMYNDVLIRDIPEEANIVGFADDIVITASERYLDEIEMIANETAEIIRTWMKKLDLNWQNWKL